MSYPTYTKAIICYIEAHIKDDRIDYKALEKRIGFSLAHIRDIFQGCTGYPLVKYIRMRKIKCSAMDLINTDKTILEISYLYGFANPETYTRAFSHVLGMTPSKFRSNKAIVGKEEIFTGVYGIGVLKDKERLTDIINKKSINNNDSTILYGVPRVEYGTYGGNTPYPICLKACAEYLGESIDYDYAMVASCAAFRFVWNNKMWDLSNVDIFHTFNETNDIYSFGAKALGREFTYLERDKGTTKEDFFSFIKKHIDEGYPCIALGVIGPPEPCIITGYINNGEKLLGWNFYQHDLEFAANVEIDESGYFVSSNWWNNTDTSIAMCIGAIEKEKQTNEEILLNAIKIIEGRIDNDYSKGLLAYKAWEKALINDDNFSVNENYSLLYEKLLCHADAMSCIIDGRKNAASYFKKQAKAISNNSYCYEKLARLFESCAKSIQKMYGLYGSLSNMDEMLKNLASSEIRKATCGLIRRASQAEYSAYMLMKSLVNKGGQENE